MPEYADVIYNISEMWVAAYNGDGTFGDPSFIEYGQMMSFESDTASEELDAYGLTVEMLAIDKKMTGTLSFGAQNFAPLGIMLGITPTESGTTPSRQTSLDFSVGGEGHPYFGIIAAGVSVGGANVIVGMPRCKLAAIPTYNLEQNTFRVGEAEYNALAPSQVIRKSCRIVRHETAVVVPNTASTFADFFTGMFDS